jgi:hypothetical protein
VGLVSYDRFVLRRLALPGATAPATIEGVDMKYIWINEGDGWMPHMTFKSDDETSTMMSDARAEIEDLRESGIKAKFGVSFPKGEST